MINNGITNVINGKIIIKVNNISSFWRIGPANGNVEKITINHIIKDVQNIFSSPNNYFNLEIRCSLLFSSFTDSR